MNKMSVASIALVILLLSMLNIMTPGGDSATPPEPPAPRHPTFTVQFNMDSIDIQSGPMSSATAEVTGNLTIEKPPEARTERVFLELGVEFASEDLIGSATPHEYVTSPIEMVHVIEFRIQIMMVSPMSSSDIDGTFKLKGSWSYDTLEGDGTFSGPGCVAVILPYCYILASVSNQNDLIGFPVGESRTARMEVFNKGNAPMTVTIYKGAVSEGLDVTFHKKTITIPEKQSREVEIEVDQKDGRGDDHGFTMILDGRTGDDTDSYSIDVHVKTNDSPTSLFTNIWVKIGIGIMALLLVLYLVFFFLSRKGKKNKRMAEAEVDIQL